MPRNTREWSRRKLDEALLGIRGAIAHAEEVRAIYEPQHPEIAEVVMQSQQAMLLAEDLLVKLKGSY